MSSKNLRAYEISGDSAEALCCVQRPTGRKTGRYILKSAEMYLKKEMLGVERATEDALGWL